MGTLGWFDKLTTNGLGVSATVRWPFDGAQDDPSTGSGRPDWVLGVVWRGNRWKFDGFGGVAPVRFFAWGGYTGRSIS